MQTQILKLKEVIWEVTPECYNNCRYCGSKGNVKEKFSMENFENVIEALLNYPPLALDISGGDPLNLTMECHAKILALREKIADVKMLFNPLSLRDDNRRMLYQSLRKLPKEQGYTWYGMSVNTEEELECASDKNMTGWDLTGITVITNFNRLNLYLFDQIEKFVLENDMMWMVQFTIYKEENSDRALYTSDLATSALQDKIDKSEAKIILSDNCSPGQCGAGKCTCGILHTGEVVPCLSMRSWCEDIKYEVQGKISTGELFGLKDIWESKFRTQRFQEFLCCKDACRNKLLVRESSKFKLVEMAKNRVKPIISPKDLFPDIPVLPNKNVMMYGVMQEGALIYGVVSPQDTQVQMYGVIGAGSWGYSSNSEERK